MKSMLSILLVLVLLSVNALAEQRPWHNPPGGASSTLPDNAKIQIYTPSAGSQTVTGSVIRTTPSDTPLSTQPISNANPYQRVAEFRNAAGVITSYITANGTLVLGTPVALAVTSVYPANGATGVSISDVPQLTTNIAAYPPTSVLYVQGSSAAPVCADNICNIPATLAPNTTYTIKFLRQNIVHTSGETTSSCGPMPDVSGVCQSTFTTGP